MKKSMWKLVRQVFIRETGKMLTQAQGEREINLLAGKHAAGTMSVRDKDLWTELGFKLPSPNAEANGKPSKPRMLYYAIAVEQGTDHKVAKDIRRNAIIENLGRKISKVIIPREHYTHFQDGQKFERTRLIYPGYLIIRMKYTGATEALVNGIRNVIGFLPLPIPLHNPPTEDEIDAMVGWAPKALETEEEARILLDEQTFKAKPEPDPTKPVPKKPVVPTTGPTYRVGDVVVITAGVFMGMEGVVQASLTPGLLKVDIGLMGQSVPVDTHPSHVRAKARVTGTGTGGR